MRGHIRRQGRKSWAVVLDIGFDQRGRRRQKWHTVRGTKRDAEKELSRILRELDTAAYVEPTKLTVGEFLEQWLESHARRAVSAKTFERYAEIARKHLIPALGAHRLVDLRPLHVQAYYGEALVSGRRDGRVDSPPKPSSITTGSSSRPSSRRFAGSCSPAIRRTPSTRLGLSLPNPSPSTRRQRQPSSGPRPVRAFTFPSCWPSRRGFAGGSS